MARANSQLGELFEGFHDPRRFYTQVPDYLIDFLMRDLKGSELKVLYYVARHTFGFLRDDAAISWSRFLEGTMSREGRRLDWGAGVSRRALKESLDSLIEEKRLLVKERQSSTRRGDEASLYSLHLRQHEDEEPARDLDGHWGFRLMPHSTGVPNQLFDVLLPHLTEGELKVISYIVRRTLGLKEETAEISYSQFTRGLTAQNGRVLDLGTGLSERTVQNALAGLMIKRCIRRLGSTPEREAGATYAYRLRRTGEDDGVAESITGDQKEVAHGAGKKYHTGVEESSTGMGSRKYHTGVARSITHEKQCLKTGEDREETQQHTLLVTEQSSSSDVVVALINLGVTKKIANKLALSHARDFILAQIDMLPYRKADDPAAVLVKAIKEGWAPPPGYETPQQREERAARDAEEAAGREEAADEARRRRESWRERMVAAHAIDDETLEAWGRAQRQLRLHVGRVRYAQLFERALLKPSPNGRAVVLVQSYAQKTELRDEHRRALEAVLAGVLGRGVTAELVWEG